jgi:hypothetical protein
VEVKMYESKICTTCKIDKHNSQFYKQENGIMGVRPNCKECEKNRKANYWDSNKDKCVKSRYKWQGSNPKYYIDRKKKDIQFKLTCLLRSRLYIAIKNSQKVGSSIHDLGCSVDFLKSHLESLFQEGMSWENWSMCGWHIDHIIPLSSFNLENREELLKACHYTNLQPLWAKDNLRKSNSHPGSTPLL